jgi:two-component system, NtrC family, nitrogen regulation response regulator NtrX
MDEINGADRTRLETKRVLIVEDDDGVREALENVLSDERYIVWSAIDGADAMAVLEREKLVPGLIVLDLWMPQMDGAAFVQTLRANPRYREVPVLIVSADVHVAEVSTSLGAVVSFPKPFDLDRFIEAVRRFFQAP